MVLRDFLIGLFPRPGVFKHCLRHTPKQRAQNQTYFLNDANAYLRIF